MFGNVWFKILDIFPCIFFFKPTVSGVVSTFSTTVAVPFRSNIPRTGFFLFLRWLFSRSTTISTATIIEVKLIQSLVYWLINGYSVYPMKQRLAFRNIFVGSRFPPLWIDKIAVFMHSLFYKGHIGDDILCWYDIHVTHMNFLDKISNLLVLMNYPKMLSGVKIILKYVSDVL